MSPYAALVIAYRRPDLIAAVLERLAAQTVAPAEVLVIDNGGDLPESAVAGTGLPVRVIRRPDNPGYAGAVNVAREVLAAGTGRLLVLTHDAEFGPELAERLLAPLERDPRVGATGPVLMRVSDPTRVFSAGGGLTRGGRAFHELEVPAEDRAVRWLDGAIVMFRREALDAIGWISEDYFLYFEDVDTGWRLERHGYSSVVVADAVARQEPGPHPPYLGIRNMTLFARTAHLPPLAAAGSVLRRIAEESAVAVVRRRRPPVLRCLRGWADGRRGLAGKPAAWPRC